MSAGHTPGPWSFDGPLSSIIVWGAEPDIRVCFMTSDGPAKANARLIAAAPDLLEALRAFIAEADAGHVTIETDKAARAAIARATGEQP